ncbi:MAG: hypothetical protein LAO23_06765 [Acidobacteriia bacterium]|nr:hypothetical protein [Terriglobia bacterium]
MITSKQFRDLPENDRVGTFEKLFRAALVSFLPDLAAAPWYVREREVVNLFVFGHLIPQFQDHDLDIRQLCIEVPVLKLRKSTNDELAKPEISQPGTGGPVSKPPKAPRQTLGKYGDIVVWTHNKATIWQTCRPLAHIEWKNINCLEKYPKKQLERAHEQDICLLQHNRSLVCVSYAVLTDWRNCHVEMRCKKISNGSDGKDPEDFFSPIFGPLPPHPAGIEVFQRDAPNRNLVWCLKSAAICPDKAIADLQHTYSELLLRPQGSACPDRIAHPSASADHGTTTI